MNTTNATKTAKPTTKQVQVLAYLAANPGRLACLGVQGLYSPTGWVSAKKIMIANGWIRKEQSPEGLDVLFVNI